MLWPFHDRLQAKYWLKVFGLYALAEAAIQLIFLYILNNYGSRPISNWEFHFIMWVFQCLLIWPIWWMAWLLCGQSIILQITTAIGFYILYSYFWFGPVQETISFFHERLQDLTRSPQTRMKGLVDQANNYSYINYQLLKHAFRLSWFFLANYFYRYRLEEKKRLDLAIANKELQLKLLKWHLNPQFYFKTIDHLRDVAANRPANCTEPILKLAKVMEYVIYEAKEKLIDVKKEIHFLKNYLELMSRQPGGHVLFHLNVKGEYEKLRIAPLLLAAFVDKISGLKDNGDIKQYELCLEFSGTNMEFRLSSKLNEDQHLKLPDNEPALTRLKELYPGRFSILHSNCKNLLELKLELDEQN